MSSSPVDASLYVGLRAIIAGGVQDVGYRWFVARQARSRGIVGYVRNLPDGTVEVEAEGERAALEQLLIALAKGPLAARVKSVTPAWSAYRSAFERFEVRR